MVDLKHQVSLFLPDQKDRLLHLLSVPDCLLDLVAQVDLADQAHQEEPADQLRHLA